MRIPKELLGRKVETIEEVLKKGKANYSEEVSDSENLGEQLELRDRNEEIFTFSSTGIGIDEGKVSVSEAMEVFDNIEGKSGDSGAPCYMFGKVLMLFGENFLFISDKNKAIEYRLPLPENMGELIFYLNKCVPGLGYIKKQITRKEIRLSN